MTPIKSLLILLAMSCVNSFPLGYYDPTDWEYIYPQLNASLADYCYYNNSEWKSNPKNPNYMWCEVLIGPTEDLDLFPDPLIRPLTELFKKHVINDMEDKLKVFDCFLKNRYNESLPNCKVIPLMNVLGNTLGQRQSRMEDYFKLLSDVSAALDYCWYLIEAPSWLSSSSDQDARCTMSLMNEIHVAEHCSQYHPYRLMPSYGPCKALRNPPITAPTSIRLIARYIEWANQTVKNKQDHMPFEDVPIELKGYRNRLNSCYNTNDWIGDQMHWCHSIVNPFPDVDYCRIDRLLQEEWNKVTRSLFMKDCATNHKLNQTRCDSIYKEAYSHE